jgi:peptidyl-prolyl cis-trans isomerase B (cyclophilin B)
MRLFLISILTLLTFGSIAHAEDKKNMAANQQVKLETSLGDIIIELNAEKAPISAQNFIDYVNSGFYDGTIFHRVIPGFMAQGGGFDKDFKQKSVKAPIKNEADNGVKNTRGTLAMARTNDPESATAQFFINLKDNGFLNHTAKTSQGWGYAVFGQVIDGMEVVDKMAEQPTGSNGGHQDVPKTTITINKASLVSAAK